MKFLLVDDELFRTAPWTAEFNGTVDDYLRRSGEEITFEAEWKYLAAAIQGQTGLRLVVCVDDTLDVLLGWMLLRELETPLPAGKLLHVWQVYVLPGRVRLRDAFNAALPLFASMKRRFGFTRLQMFTGRALGKQGRAYDKILRELGFRPIGITYQREL